MKFDHLREVATVRQLEYIEAVEKHGSYRAAAKAMGLNKDTVRESLVLLQKRADISIARKERAAHLSNRVPDGYVIKGASTYFDKTGNPAGQWLKTTVDTERQAEMMRAASEAMSADLPRVAPVKAPKATCANLLTTYIMTDCHLGMLAWHKEGGADWDLKIAEAVLTGCFEHMVANSPKSKVGLVAQLGDFLHADGLIPITPTSGHVLDADGRFSKVVQASIRVLRRLVDFALSHHEQVVVLMAEGNHDLSSSVWLRAMFKALYENEPRVLVIDSELPYYCHQFGQTMIAFHHGHLKKNDELPLLFAAQFPKVWGGTVKRYAHTGHRHHHEEKEHSGMTVIQHPTLAARDAYASRGGWVAERQATSLTYHERFGLVARNTVTPEMLEAA